MMKKTKKWKRRIGLVLAVIMLFEASGLSSVATLFAATTNDETAGVASQQAVEPVETSESEETAEDLTISSAYSLKDNMVVGNLTINSGSLQLNGYQLKVLGNISQKGGSVTLGGGTLFCKGNYTFAGNSSLIMNSQNDYLKIMGDFLCQSNYAMSSVTAGILEFDGDFIQKNTSYSASKRNFISNGTSEVIFGGNSVQNINFESSSSYFALVTLKNTSEEGIVSKGLINSLDMNRNGVNITTELEGTYGWKLTEDETYEGNLVFIGDCLDLNGYKLNVTGNLIQTNGTIKLNGGTLKVEKDYRIQSYSEKDGERLYSSASARLSSRKENGILSVQGDFITEATTTQNTYFTKGELQVGGNVSQIETSIKDNFVMTGTSKLLLCGEEKQSLSIASGGGSNSRLQNFEIANRQGVELAYHTYVMGEISDHKNPVTGKSVVIQNSTTFVDKSFSGNIYITSSLNLSELREIGGNLTSAAYVTLQDNLEVQENVVVKYSFHLNGKQLRVGKKLTLENWFYVEGGSLTCHGDMEMISDTSGSNFLSMKDGEDYVLVYGDFYAKSKYKMDETRMSAGTLELKGDYVQSTVAEKGNFCASGTHRTIISGDKKQTVTFSDNYSYFNVVEIKNTSEEGVYAPNGIHCNSLIKNGNNVTTDLSGVEGWKLTEDETINGNFELVSGELDLNGHTLTIDGNLLQSGGNINVNNGNLVVEGDYRIQTAIVDGEKVTYGESSGNLIMTNADDRLTVNGSFVMGSLYSHKGKLTAGTMKVAGDICAIKYNASDNFALTDNIVLILNGSGKQVVNLSNPSLSYMRVANLEIQNRSEEGVVFETFLPVTKTVKDNGNRTKGAILIDRAVSFTDGAYQGNIRVANGGTLGNLKEVGGNLTIASYNNLSCNLHIKGTLSVISGRLDLLGKECQVDGDVNIKAAYIYLDKGKLTCDSNLNLEYDSNSNSYIAMKFEEDYILVKGNVSVSSRSISQMEMQKGIFEFKGDFTQSKTEYAANFIVGGSCKVVLSGNRLQTVSFETNESYFTYVDLQNTSNEGVYSENGIHCKHIELNGNIYRTGKSGNHGSILSEDKEYDGDFVLSSGTLDLNGKKLTVHGNLVQLGGTVKVNGGELIVEGDYLVGEEDGSGSFASLFMTKEKDKVYVLGDFAMASFVDQSDCLTAGKLYVGGDFTQKTTLLKTNFASKDTFELIMCGDKEQYIIMDAPSSSCSKIANLTIDNTSEEGVALNSTLVTNHVNIISGQTSGYLSIVATTTFEDNTFDGNIIIKESITYPRDLHVKGNMKNNVYFRMEGDIKVDDELQTSNYMYLQGHTLEVGGTMSICAGRIIVDKGKVICNSDVNLEYYKSVASGFYMVNEEDFVLIQGDFYVDTATAVTMSKGTMELQGDFIQNRYYDRNAFSPAIAFTTILSGSEKQMIHFSEEGSQFGTLEVKNESAEGVYFSNDSIRALKLLRNGCRVSCDGTGTYGWTLEEDTVLEGDLNIIADVLDLNGHKLTVHGNLYIGSGELQINGGSLEVSGDLRLQNCSQDNVYSSGSGQLVMNQEKDYVMVEGDFIVQSSLSGKSCLTAGTLEIKGDFWQIPGNNTVSDNFTPSGTHKTVFCGTKEQTVSFSNTNMSFFKNLSIENTTANVRFCSHVICNGTVEDNEKKVICANNYNVMLTSLGQLKDGTFGGNVCLTKADTLTQDITIGGMLFTNYDLNLVGHTITTGSFQKESGNLIIGKGKLYSLGDMTFTSTGYLQMTNDEDIVRVNGNMVVSTNLGKKHTLTAGTLELCGDLNVSYNNFVASGTHKTILSGKKNNQGRNYIQFITFSNDTHKFNDLILKKNLETCYLFSHDVEKMCNHLEVDDSDQEPPLKVDGVQVTKVTASMVSLSWKESADKEGVAGYQIYRNAKLVGVTAGMNYTDIGLAPDTSYSYTVCAYDAKENVSEHSDVLDVMTSSDDEAPKTPEGVKLVTQTGSSVTIAWNRARDNVKVTGYHIYRDGERIATVSSDVLKYKDTTCEDGVIYSYAVEAFDAADNISGRSEEVTGKVAKPEITKVEPQDNSILGGERISLMAYFKDVGNSIGNKVRFQYRTLEGENWEDINVSCIGQNTFNQTTLFSGYLWDISKMKSGVYKVKVTLSDSDENTDTKEFTYTIDRTGPVTPDYIEAVADNGIIEVAWSESASANCDEYEVYRACEDEEYQKIGSTSGRKMTTYEDREVVADKKYTYYVIPVDEYGQKGTLSEKAEVVATVDEIKPVMESFSLDKARINPTTKFSVKASDNVEVEKIVISCKQGEEWLELGSIEGKGGVLKATGELTSGTHTFRAIAKDINGNMSEPYEKEFVVDTTGIQKPDIVSATITDRTARITWNMPAEEDFAYYAIEQLIDGKYKEIEKESGRLGTYISGLTYNTMYQFRVVGYDDIGNRGEESDEILLTTKQDTSAPRVMEFLPKNPYAGKEIPLRIVCEDENGLKDLTISYSTDHKTWTELTTLDAPLGEKKYTFNYTMDIQDLPEDKIYVKVEVTDICGNACGKTGETIERLFYKDITPPNAVKLKATGEEGYIEVSWEIPENDTVASFDLYRLDEATGEFSCIRQGITTSNHYDVTYDDTKVYTYRVVVTDLAGNKSGFSNIVSAIPKADNTEPEIHGMIPDKGETIGKNATLHTLISDNQRLKEVSIEYHKKGDNGTWISLYKKASYSDCEDLFLTWKNEELENGEYEFRINATDIQGNAAKEYRTSYVLDKTEKPKDEPEPEPKFELSVNTETNQRAESEYRFDAFDCFSNISTLENFHWDFGDGTTAEGVQTVHSYQNTGEYTVTLTAKDKKGNTESKTQKVRVAKKNSGGLTVKVTNQSGQAISDAMIYIEKMPDDGKGETYQADENGEFHANLNSATYEISAYQNGYLPSKQKVKMVKGSVKELTFELKKENVVVGTLSHRKLDMREIEKLGVDLSIEDNWYTYTYLVYIGKENAPSTKRFTLRRGSSYSIGLGNGCSLVLGTTGVSDHEILYEYRTVRFLKQMFQVELKLENMAAKDFTLTDGDAVINLPEGLSLAGMKKGYEQSEKVSLKNMPGGSSQSVKWIIRGDQPGSYSVSAEFNARLQPFNAPVSAKIVDKEPIVVTLSNENTSTDLEFLDDSKKTEDYQIAVSDVTGKDVQGAYIELAYNGYSFRALTDSNGLGHLEVNAGDDRTFTLTVTSDDYPDYIDDDYRINTGDYMDSVVVGGKNNKGMPYPEDGGDGYDGDFALQYASVNSESLAELAYVIETSDEKTNTFELSFSEKASSVNLYAKEDGKTKTIITKSNNLSKNGLNSKIEVESSQFKEGYMLYVKAVDADTKTEHHYKLENLTFSEGKLQKAEEKELTISLNTAGNEKTGSVTTTFNPNWLSDSPTKYNHNLARFNMALSSVSYCEDTGSEYGDLDNKNYYNALTKLGFTVEGGEKCLKLAESSPGAPSSKSDRQTIHYYLASNRYKMNGKETDVVILTLRGTKGNEWYDNFDIDYDNTGKNCNIHDGFNNGASAMKEVLIQYISKNKLTKNLKIIITGHSRGAAVTNLLAAKLALDGNSFVDINGKKKSISVFAYAYACPNTVSIKKIEKDGGAKIFGNIFNFVNPDDFVTKVVPSKWGFGRYGTTYVFPAKMDNLDVVGEQNNFVSENSYSDKLFQKFVKDVGTKFTAYRNGETYDPYDKGMKPVSELIDTITKTVKNTEDYYTKNLSDIKYIISVTLEDIFKNTLAEFMVTESVTTVVTLITAACGNYGGAIGHEVGGFFLIHNNTLLTKSFDYAHTYETYLAMINTVTESQLKAPKKTLKGIVNCPVDIEIYNEEDTLIGQIKDNQVNEEIDSKGEVSFEVIGDSKQFYLDTSLKYTVKLTGNDNGTMDYIASEEDLDAGEEERVIFKKVPVEKGKEMKVQVEPGQDVTSQVLVKEDGTTIGYDSHLSVEDLGKVILTTEVEGIGTASSVENLTYGDAVVLSATTDGNNEFLGWYDKNGKLLSKEAEYPVIATEDKTYVAKFTDNYIEASDVLMPAKLNMKPGETKELEAEVVPQNATYPFLTYESSDTSVVSIDLFGNVTALKNGTATITVTSVTEERTAVCTIVVSATGEEISEPEETPSVAMPTPEAVVPQTPTNVGELTANPIIPTEPEKRTKSRFGGSLAKTVIRSVKVNKKSIVLTYKKVKGAKKYQIQVSRNKGFKKSKNYTTKKLAYVLKKLKKKKVYYIRVRGLNGKVKGRWSKVRKVKIK